MDMVTLASHHHGSVTVQQGGCWYGIDESDGELAEDSGLDLVRNEPPLLAAPSSVDVALQVGTAIKTKFSSTMCLASLVSSGFGMQDFRRGHGLRPVRTLPGSLQHMRTSTGSGSAGPNPAGQTAVRRCDSGECTQGVPKAATMTTLGLPPLLRRRSSLRTQQTVGSHMAFRVESDQSIADLSDCEQKCSILDFEHLFVQYYIEVRPRARHGPWTGVGGRMFRRAGASGARVVPSADHVAEVWKDEALTCIMKHKEACQRRWPGLRLSRGALKKRIDAELGWTDELSGPRSRIVLTLKPEHVCHRIFWAVGDAIAPSRILSDIEVGCAKQLPQCRVRCADSFLNPPSVFRTLLAIFSVLLVVCIRVLARAAVLASSDALGPQQRHLGPTRDEKFDQLAARFLLTGSVAQLWLLHAVAMAFPLRSLHSPFKRDLGCLTAYSSIAMWLGRLVAPIIASAMPIAMAIRFERLGLALFVPGSLRPLGVHTLAFGSALSLPFLTLATAWSVRSSLYSHHQAFILLLFLTHLVAALGFAAYFEMVKWAVLALAALVVLALYLFSMYTMEFTSVSLHKAAQFQWACAHMVPLLMLLLAAALEVESGAAKALVDFICGAQDVIPKKMCIRLLSNAS
mmetsp:Transcript_48649/g.135967  ORF Transcript_48649/g.135967 Transcript_48649/m.135967 type:complete len:628 (+) Transcript_48649:97-1980(+)